MKLNKYSWLAALPLLFTACQDDMLVEKHSQQGIYTLTATMDGGADSRAQIVLNGTSTTKESFHWNEGDAFTLFQLPVKDAEGNVVTEMSSHEFTISDAYSDEEPTASADFSTLDALTVGREFVAFYPTPVVDAENSYKVGWDLESTLPDNSVASWKNYFRNNLFMMVKGTVSNTTSLAFEHLSGIIRITYKNTSTVDRKINGIFVAESDMTTGVDFDLSNNCSLAGGSGRSGMVGLNFDNNATIAAGTSEDFYIIFMKNLFEDKGMAAFSKIGIITAENVLLSTPEYSKELPEMEAGKCYWYNVTDDGNKLFWTNDQQGGDDSGDNEGTTVETHTATVSDFIELRDALAVKANQTKITFVNDIVLDTPLTITCPTTFYMKGHAITLHESNYKTNGLDAVFDVVASLDIQCGSILGLDKSTKLHDYYFKLSGQHAFLGLRGVSLITKTAISNAVFMNDDYIRMSEFTTGSEVYMSSIQTRGNAIHYIANGQTPRYFSDFDGVVAGDVYIQTDYDRLNASMCFKAGTISGNLKCEVPEGLDIAEFIEYSWEDVLIEDAYKDSWKNVGRYVEDQKYSVTTFEQLKAAINAEQIHDEFTEITLCNDIFLSSPLTINKSIVINGNYTMTYIGDSEPAFTVIGENQKSLVFWLENASLVAEGVSTAISLKDCQFQLTGSSSVTASVGSFALNILSETRYSSAMLETSGTMTGNVGFTVNYIDSAIRTYFDLFEGTVLGDLITSGTYANDVSIYIHGGDVKGIGWPNQDGSNDSEDTEPVFAKVSNFQELKTALADKTINYIELDDDIVLDGPLSISHTVTLVLMDYTMSLSSSYPSDASDVINVIGDDIRFMFVQGNVDCTANTIKLNNFIKLSGKSIDFQFADVVMNTGDYIGNAIYMDDDNLDMFYSQRTTDITALNAIYLVSNETNKGYSSSIDINGSINGNLFFQSNSGELNTHLEITAGTMNGELMFNGVNESVNKADYIKYNEEAVTFGTQAKGWDQAGILE